MAAHALCPDCRQSATPEWEREAWSPLEIVGVLALLLGSAFVVLAALALVVRS